MPFVSPEEIATKAENAYSRFLKKWIRGEAKEFFPFRVRVRLSINPDNARATIVASEKLLSKSKAQRGWGYTVHREHVRTRDFGNNLVPKAITIDMLDDLLLLANKSDNFVATKLVVDRVRAEIPQLNDWLTQNVLSLNKFSDSIEELISVTQFFIKNPWPDCYSRQIPVPVHTKFVDQHKTILRQWLDLLLPSSAIDVNESKFGQRFGLRDGQPHRAIRLLDSRLLHELDLPCSELSLPLRSIASLPVKDTTTFIVENSLNLLTLPSFYRGIGIRGEGNAVNRLERLKWLNTNRILYWGDIDVDGFLILSRLRNIFPHVESIMMDRDVMERHQDYIVGGNGSTPPMPTNLTSSETAAFVFCAQNDRRLEQEKILQPYVDRSLVDLDLFSDR